VAEEEELGSNVLQVTKSNPMPGARSSDPRQSERTQSEADQGLAGGERETDPGVYLPPYSPELNPCEYFNGELKGEIQRDISMQCNHSTLYEMPRMQRRDYPKALP
jgi:hypothetical protein